MTGQKPPSKAGRPARISEAAILASAASLLEQLGEQQFSMRKLSTAMGIGLSSLYHYYPSKSALFTALADTLINQTWNQATLAGRDWQSKLRQWAFTLRDELSHNGLLAWLFSQSTPDILLTELEGLALVIKESGLPRPQALLMAQSFLWTVVSFQYMSTVPTNRKFVEEKKAAENSDNHKHRETLEVVATDQFDDLFAMTIENKIRGLENYPDD